MDEWDEQYKYNQLSSLHICHWYAVRNGSEKTHLVGEVLWKGWVGILC